MLHSSIANNSTCQGMERPKFFIPIMAQILAAWNSDSLRKLVNSSVPHRHPVSPKQWSCGTHSANSQETAQESFEDKKDPYLQLWSCKIHQFLEWVTSTVTDESSHQKYEFIQSKLLKPMTYNTKKVQSALGARQQIQKENFDRSSKAFKLLEPGDTIRLRQGNTAALVGESKVGQPRSYIVRANNHEYRRNRKDILKTQETSHSELADSADSDRPAEDTRQIESH